MRDYSKFAIVIMLYGSTLIVTFFMLLVLKVTVFTTALLYSAFNQVLMFSKKYKSYKKKHINPNY